MKLDENDLHVLGILKVKNKRTNSIYFIRHDYALLQKKFCKIFNYDPIKSILNIKNNYNQTSEFYARLQIRNKLNLM